MTPIMEITQNRIKPPLLTVVPPSIGGNISEGIGEGDARLNKLSIASDKLMRVAANITTIANPSVALRQALDDYNTAFALELVKMDKESATMPALEKSTEAVEQYGAQVNTAFRALSGSGEFNSNGFSIDSMPHEKFPELIDNTKQTEIDPIAEAFKKYTELFDEITALLDLITKGAIVDAEGKTYTIKLTDLREKLSKLIEKYEGVAGKLFSGLSKEKAEEWIKKLGLPAGSLKDIGGGKYDVVIDLEHIKGMFNNILADGTGIPAATYQAWRAGFDAHKEAIQTLLTTVADRFSGANAKFDGFVKLLSSLMAAIFDALKAFHNL